MEVVTKAIEMLFAAIGLGTLIGLTVGSAAMAYHVLRKIL